MQRMNYSGTFRKVFGIHYLCIVCKRNDIKKPVNYYDDNFLKHRGPFPVTVHGVCFNCAKTTRRFFTKLKKLHLKEMPLYINDDNLFIRNLAINRLKKGE
jgi:hypothetical protein